MTPNNDPTSLTTRQANVSRIEALDAIRQLAAFVVFVQHFFIIFEIAAPKWLRVGIFDAKGAVTLFFVLSGYVLALSLSKSTPSIRNYVNFGIRRVLRLYPMHLAATTLSLVVLVWVKEHGGFQRPHALPAQFLESATFELRQWLLQTTLVLPGMRSDFANPPVWTLMTEAKVAIVFPFIAWAILRLSPTFACLLVGCLVIGSDWADRHLVGTVALLGQFALGALLARLPHGRLATMKLWQWSVWIVLSIALYSAVSYRYHLGSLWIAFYLCSFGAAGLIVATSNWDLLNGGLTKLQRVFRVDISYGLYILHYPIMSWLRKLTNETASSFTTSIYFFISLLATVILSVTLLHVIERPAIRMGRRLTLKK